MHSTQQKNTPTPYTSPLRTVPQQTKVVTQQETTRAFIPVYALNAALYTPIVVLTPQNSTIIPVYNVAQDNNMWPQEPWPIDR